MIELKSGDRLGVVRPFITLSNVMYVKGDILELIEPTGLDPWSNGGEFDAPHGWIVKCKAWCPPQSESIWYGINHCIEVGLLKKV
jgi:hypothetical protein